MAVDARSPRSRAGLRRSLPLVFGLPLLALVITAMYWHSVLASALTPTRPSTAVVAVVADPDHAPTLAGDGSEVAGVTGSTDRDVRGIVDGYPQIIDAGSVADLPTAKIIVADGIGPEACGPRAPPR
jgi:hypothetical protein